MTTEQLTSIVSIIISLACSYLPGVADWYQNVSGVAKRLIMLVLLASTSLVIFGLSCWQISAGWVNVTCDPAGAAGLFRAFFAAVISSQAVFLISPKNTWSKPLR